MKKTAFLLSAILILLSSCNLSLPQNVTLKMDADYNFAIGNIEKDFNSSFDKSALFSGLENSEKIRAYDYNPGQKSESLQQFIIDMEIGTLDSSAFRLSGVVPEGISFDDLQLTGTTRIDIDMSQIFSSLDVLGSEFKDKADFYKIPVYVYCNVASGFSDSQLTKNSGATVKGALVFSSPVTSDVCAIGESDAPITQMDFPVLKNAAGQEVSDDSVEDKVVVTDLETAGYSLSGDMGAFANVCKDSSGDMEVTYDLAFSGTTTGEDIRITIHACMIMQLAFEIDTSDLSGDEKDSPLKIDLIALAKKDSEQSNADIFNRSEATDLGEIEKYIDIIEQVSIEYSTRRTPVTSNGKMQYVVKSIIPYFSKSMDYDNGQLTLTSDDFMDMLETYPYKPDLYLVIANKSVIKLPRDISLDMNMNICVSADGELKL